MRRLGTHTCGCPLPNTCPTGRAKMMCVCVCVCVCVNVLASHLMPGQTKQLLHQAKELR
jgi:hypothetical protein